MLNMWLLPLNRGKNHQTYSWHLSHPLSLDRPAEFKASKWWCAIIRYRLLFYSMAYWIMIGIKAKNTFIIWGSSKISSIVRGTQALKTKSLTMMDSIDWYTHPTEMWKLGVGKQIKIHHFHDDTVIDTNVEGSYPTLTRLSRTCRLQVLFHTLHLRLILESYMLKFASIQLVLFLFHYYPSFNYIITVTYVETVTY